MRELTKKERFNDKVLSRFNLYNSIFSTLPYESIAKTGVMLPLFERICIDGYKKSNNPTKIVNDFFATYMSGSDDPEKVSLLFRFIQYIERQVVLFDAVEDASFSQINNLDGRGTLRSLKEEVESKNKKSELKKYLSKFKIRPVLTAHPTQFYPGSVLGIITDLTSAVKNNNLAEIKVLLSQLGKTPFFKNKKPTPYDEAVSLTWYLENVFYNSISNIYKYIKINIFDGKDFDNDIVNLGFWPGGDRDGNPFVTTKITLKTANKLRSDIIKNYYRDIRSLRRRLTFKNIEDKVVEIENRLYKSIFNESKTPKISLDELKTELNKIKNILINEHNSLFLEELDEIIDKVKIFGYHFASLDIRQDSRIHSSVFNSVFKIAQKTLNKLFPDNYLDLNEEKKIKILSKIKGDISPDLFNDELSVSTLSSIRAMKEIQSNNGEKACNRYIISNNQSALNILEVFTMFRLSNWENPTVDIVPLFETVSDLKVASKVMESVYANPVYKNHLKQRNNQQTIMLGFSDGTKDGGYLMANWSILKAKEALTSVSRKHGIKVIFFDGRGGPPARGGGNTHQFYSSMGEFVESDEIQLTVQGQTISSNFGTVQSCQYNLEQLLSSGIQNRVLSDVNNSSSKEDKLILDKLANISYKAYTDFKNHPMFVPYLEHVSTIKYYAKTNIGSRPSKRGSADAKFDFSSLRAIPFVGSWSQLKQNVPGFYGVGTALKYYSDRKEFSKIKNLYKSSPFFRTLISNSMMSLTKSFFKLTAYMKNDPQYGEFWLLIYNEYKLTKKLILRLSGFDHLMQNEPANKASIQTREKIVLPLITIQQYALRKIKDIENGNHPKKDLSLYEKMVTRSLFGNINASRNSA
ncbi:MAG: phosphoenolpyruvate carboxylase [Flavobacteriaceae bacterium]|nr:phosphoenolpyruvate carboxylase [Flavobacteriaceae bacterium]MBT7572840.1 phosphoenolpyruvate carboxylase [Flavobacteriaceae bacterium]